MAYFSPVIPGLDFTYQYTGIRPIHNNLPIEPCPGTLWDFLVQNKEEFRLYKFLVEMAQLPQRYNDVQLDNTVFIPTDKSLLQVYDENMILNMEQHQAIKMLKYNSLNRKISMKELRSSESMKLKTRIRGQVVYTNSEHGTIRLIGDVGAPVRIMRGDIIVNNALIHITDTFLLPEMV